jgi:iron-sulfur cluster assembly protein/iron-sulfur cluster insertion protein
MDRRGHGTIETNGVATGAFSTAALRVLGQKEIAVSLATSTVKLGQRPSPVTLTDAAVAKVTALLEQEGDEGLALRVAVRPGGCSGYSYEMFFDSEFAEDDIVRSFGAVRVVIDPESAELIKGATLEYRDGLQEAGFHITNPNATRTCGCGSSFS